MFRSLYTCFDNVIFCGIYVVNKPMRGEMQLAPQVIITTVRKTDAAVSCPYSASLTVCV